MTSMYRRNSPVVWLMVAGLLSFAGCDDRDTQTESVGPTESFEKASARGGPAAAERPDDRYATAVDPGEVPAGETSPVTMSIQGGTGLHPNREYPGWSFEFKDNPDWDITPKKVTPKNVTLGDRRAYFRVEVTPKKAGAGELKATGNFSVCNDQTCHIMRDEVVEFEISAKHQGSEQ